MLFSVFNRIKRVAARIYNRSSSERFVKYLRSNGVVVGDNVLFREPFTTTIDMTRPSLITIGHDVDINENFTIMTHDFSNFVFRNYYHDFVSCSGRVTIGNNIYFGRDVTILKGVSIGNNCIIGLGSVVTKDIPDNSVACGIPCRVISSLDDYFKKRKIDQIDEALDFGVSIIERYNREPNIEDFLEEWCLFLIKTLMITIKTFIV